jgi:hypothetical protein
MLLVEVERRCRVLTLAEARANYTDLQVGRKGSIAGQPAVRRATFALRPTAPQENPLHGALSDGPARYWAEAARVAVAAHTRRGESDHVALWLVQVGRRKHESHLRIQASPMPRLACAQVLALDHKAPEWAVIAP